MRVYLDNCCFNRPFDNQNNIFVRLETEAKLWIQESIRSGFLELVWSYILDLENSENPFLLKKESIAVWREQAIVDMEESNEILNYAESLEKKGFKAKDALHIACAVSSNCNYFITTDKNILKKKNEVYEIAIVNPIEFLEAKEENVQ
jgi:predicted nucleic acid-binding protein